MKKTRLARRIWRAVTTSLFYFGEKTRLRAMEKVAGVGVLGVVILSSIFNLDFYFPDMSSGIFVVRHYIGPIVPVAFGIGLVKLKSRRPVAATMPLHYVLRDILAFVVVTWLHFNLKLWSQLINPNTLDSEYQSVDGCVMEIVILFQSVSEVIHEAFPSNMDSYHDIFVAMFVMSFFAHALQRKQEIFQKVLCATAWILLVGGLAYSVAPAMGPFAFGDWGGHGARGAQEDMLNFYERFLDSKGSSYVPAYFVAAVAAMPSLHIAHSAMFTYFALRYLPRLGLLYLPVLCFIGVEAIALRWHYLVDLVAGCFVAILCIVIAEKMEYGEKLGAPKKCHVRNSAGEPQELYSR